MRLFGLRGKGMAVPDSDLDLLVDLTSGRYLFDLIEMKPELEAATRLRVDPVTEKNPQV
jgi:predicted nucleotidyltransferase